MLGPHNTSDYPITIVVVPLLIFLCPYCPHIVITVPHRIPLLLFCGFILLLLGWLGYIVTP